MKIHFIVNPIAGKGLAQSSIPVIKNFCIDNSIEHFFHVTKFAGHAIEIAREVSTLFPDLIVAVGGDGTTLEVANGLKDSRVPLGILPLGTGNDFSKALNIPQDIKSALKLFIHTKPTATDVGLFQDKLFLNVASVGFDAEIIVDLPKVKKWIPGKAAYYISVFLKFITYKNKTISVEIDGEHFEEKVLLTAVANGNYYGGGMNVNPNGSLFDGLLDIILIRPPGKLLIPFLLMRFAAGKHLDLPFVSSYRCKSIKITSSHPLPVNGDGEIIAETPVEFKIASLSLNIINGLNEEDFNEH